MYWRNVSSRGLGKAVVRAGLDEEGKPNLRFHDLRHTYASMLIGQGEDVTYVASQMGHPRRSPWTCTRGCSTGRRGHRRRRRGWSQRTGSYSVQRRTGRLGRSLRCGRCGDDLRRSRHGRGVTCRDRAAVQAVARARAGRIRLESRWKGLESPWKGEVAAGGERRLRRRGESDSVRRNRPQVAARGERRARSTSWGSLVRAQYRPSHEGPAKGGLFRSWQRRPTQPTRPLNRH
jgi:hypothetical protein